MQTTSTVIVAEAKVCVAQLECFVKITALDIARLWRLELLEIFCIESDVRVERESHAMKVLIFSVRLAWNFDIRRFSDKNMLHLEF